MLIEIEGHVGYYCGGMNKLATVIVSGNAGQGVAENMMSGKVWVKGVIISGVATRSAPSFGVRVKFSEEELSGKEHLREFLKFVENTARKSQSGKAYVALLKD